MAHMIANNTTDHRVRCDAARVADIEGVMICLTTVTTTSTGTFTTGSCGCGGETD
jgi:hypothetical protein